MRLIKQFVCMLLLFPVLSLAQYHLENEFAIDATYKKVSPACYLAFKTTFSMLPEYGADFGFGISNVKTPSGNPSTFKLTVDYSPSGLGVGDYKIYQKYANSELYLRLDAYPESFPLERVDEVWAVVGNLLKACPFIE